MMLDYPIGNVALEEDSPPTSNLRGVSDDPDFEKS